LPKARIFRSPRNLGFGAANNVALRQCQTRYALLLNPDCLPEHGMLESLLEVAASYPEAAIIAPHLLRAGNRIELSYRWPATRWTSRGPAADGACCVGFVCGAVMLLKMEAIREAGLFDEDFFLYYEDEDLCQRVFDRKGSIILAPAVTVMHLSRGSVRGPNPLKSEFLRGFHHAQSKLIFARKHNSGMSIEWLRWRVLGLAIMTLIPRLFVPMPRYLARLIGRICGLAVFR
jgi:N-acetylglucosaminyl-diphospho-decaprenol L-rhamnosyltransferase